jgi:hypothetical protein
MRYIEAILFLISVFILHSCDKGRVETKIIDFDQFTIEVPKTWQKLIRPGEDSYLGEIIIDEQQKLSFDLGWYSNNLDEEPNYRIQDGKVYLLIDFSTPPRRIFEYIGSADTVDIEKLKRQKVEWTIIDRKKAKIVRPKKSGQGITGVYIDSLWTSGSGVDKFQLNGQDLNNKNERLLLQAIRTLKFTRE